ncbi:MAG TPA: PKD domain-containing protein [Thermoanaerobaculia bacterium]
MNLSRAARRALFVLAACLPAGVLRSATYLPMSDTELAREAPMIARATVVASDVHLEPIGGQDRPVTLVTLQLTEAIKGSPGATFVVRQPGGRVGDLAWWIPGAPVFTIGSDVVLMLGPHPGYPGQLRLTELGLSKFDLVADDSGTTFAVRAAFSAEEEAAVSKRAVVAGEAPGARPAEPFLAFLRAVAAEGAGAEVAFVPVVSSRAKWANIGGREPGDCGGSPCLFRWFWGAGSPNAVLMTSGTQTNLVNDEPKCGTDSICDVQNAGSAWPAVSGTNILLSGPASTGNITVNLDATTSQDGTTWTTPLGCTAGVIGLGGPGPGNGPRTYRGDTTYFAPTTGTVSMRKVTCASGYSAATFRSAVLHEVGHVIGLQHPDQDVSIHSTTTPADWASAVMHSVITAAKPDTPQTDDVQAVQYYYGTAAVGAAPVADFTYSPATPTAGSPVTFMDASTGTPTGWNWDFADPSQGTVGATTQNATHVYATPGKYFVLFTAGNLNGSSILTKPVTIAPGPTTCVESLTTLCLNANRFQTTIFWKKPDGSSGTGTGIPLTSDSGYFWFFDPSNIEAVVKVLNGCAINAHYWVFSAGLTNVEVTLNVLDTQNGTLQQYVNPQGTAFLPQQDTSAFSTCP